MTATMTDPVAEAQVLTALDFDTPPVEVTSNVVANPVVYTMPPGAVLTISADNVTWSVPDGEAKFVMGGSSSDLTFVDNTVSEPLMFETFAKAFKSWQPCDCPLCLRHVDGPMDPTAKALWVEALREPDRKQGRGALLRGDLWCALGVLIDVAIKAGVKVRTTVDSSGATLYDGYGGALPPAVMKWAGLRGDPMVAGVAVAARNDMGTPFPMIANLIDKCL